MSTELTVALVTGVLALVSAGALAVVNNAITTRAGIDEELRSKRLEVYLRLWALTGAVSRWPEQRLSRSTLEDLHYRLRGWYYTDGGLFLSEAARDRYGDFQKLIAAVLAHAGDSAAMLTPKRYGDLRDAASALRTALTQDLDTRRRKTRSEQRKRTEWHRKAALSAERCLQAATADESPFTGLHAPEQN
jgi:hypothetical protein